MARVLVTGASGFAGSAVCRHLLGCGWTVRGSIRRPDVTVPDGVEKVISGAIDGATDWRPALAGVDAVVHCAARVHVLRETAADPLAAFRKVNVDGTRQLAEQAVAAGVARFVCLSSIGAAVAAADPDTASPYQRSKLEAEQVLQNVAASSGMVLVVLRPPLIYGPHAPGNFARLARLVARGLPLPLASLDNRRSLLFVGNLAGAVEAALACTSSPAAPLALSDGEAVSTAELVRRIASARGRPARLLPCPPGLLRLVGRLLGLSRAMEALTGELTVDNGAAAHALGWSPRYTLDEGLALTFREAA